MAECRMCATELRVGGNWTASRRSGYDYICKGCYSIRRQEHHVRVNGPLKGAHRGPQSPEHIAARAASTRATLAATTRPCLACRSAFTPTRPAQKYCSRRCWNAAHRSHRRITSPVADLRHGDCRRILQGLPAHFVQCCVTSPPYFGLRDYGVEGQMGLERTPDEYVAELVAVLRDVRRVLRDDGTLWLNLGDSYAMRARGATGHCGMRAKQVGSTLADRRASIPTGLKRKDLLGIPWRVALALQADGWWLRSAIVWHKPSTMPQSVRDRPTGCYEHVFLLSKSARYFYDAAAIAEPVIKGSAGSPFHTGKTAIHQHGRASGKPREEREMRNARNVWTIPPQPFKGSHFATMPVDLAERCVRAGSRPGDTILDPFSGAGTTGLAATRLGRDAILVDLNGDYIEMARQRLVGSIAG